MDSTKTAELVGQYVVPITTAKERNSPQDQVQYQGEVPPQIHSEFRMVPHTQSMKGRQKQNTM